MVSAHGLIAIAVNLGADVASASVSADDDKEITEAVTSLIQDLMRHKRV